MEQKNGRWTEEGALKLRYRLRHDPKGRGNHYEWEGGTGFGMRVYRSGRRTWVCATTVTDRGTGRQRSRFFTLGQVGPMPLKDARIAAAEKLNAMRSGIDPRAAEKLAKANRGQEQQDSAARGLATTTLRQAMQYYVDNRNCAPISKSDLKSTLNANVSDWMDKPILDIDSVMLQKRYGEVLSRIKTKGAEQDARYAKLSAKDRLLKAPPGYFTGIKAANDTMKGFSRVFRYWSKKHMGLLHRAGISVPQCPTVALTDDILPEPQRVKSIPPADLAKLLSSLPSYSGNALHPLLIRLLLASGRRVGVLMSAKKSYVQSDRILIPASAERAKVRWNKKHLKHMAQVVPITPGIAEILQEIDRLGPQYGDAETWLFPARESESGHMEEERAATKGLRLHAGIRFTPHQLRHNVATAAEELGYTKSEIAELLGHGAQTVTDRYIDERVKRQRTQLISIAAKLGEMIEAAKPAGLSIRSHATRNVMPEHQGDLVLSLPNASA
jgi:integrase